MNKLLCLLSVLLLPGVWAGWAAPIFFDDAEAGTNGWTVSLTGVSTAQLWHITARDAASPSNSWWCGDETSGTYSNSTNAIECALTSPRIQLGAVSAVLAFNELFVTESCVDDCQMWLSTNDGSSWFLCASNRWGEAGEWTRHVVDLAPYSNRDLRVRFLFDTATPYFNGYRGWYVDDIEVSARADADGDQVWDYEEAWLGTEPDRADSDGDGVGDGEEFYFAGTQPTSGNSVLKFSRFEVKGAGGVRLQWPAEPDRRYRLFAADSLTSAWASTGIAITGTPESAWCATNLVALAVGPYYRLELNDLPALPTTGFGCDTNGRSQLYTNSFVVWGDLHAHTQYSDDAAQRPPGCTFIPAQALSNTLGLLDFVSITDHAETNIPGFYTLEKWTNMIAQIIAFQNTHTQMVVFPGFEYTKTWMSTPPFWPIPDGNGHKNIILYDFEHLPDRGYGQDVFIMPTQLWAYLDSSNAAGHYLCIPHHPAKGSEPGDPDPWISMGTDWGTNYLRKDMLCLVEIYSRHGGSEMEEAEEPVHNFKTPGAIVAALDRWLAGGHNPAYKLGIIGSTDTHLGKPGDVREEADNVQSWLGPYTGGLAALLVTNRSREAFWYALKSKNCYGTSGGRIGIEFTAKLGEALAPMGGTLYHAQDFNATNYGQVNLHVRAESQSDSNAIARIQIFRNSACVLDVTNAAWARTVHLDCTDRLSNNYAYYRMKCWQEAVTLNPSCRYERAWSSPIWIERQ